jgi:alcohol dehydrogenase (NADP+)
MKTNAYAARDAGSPMAPLTIERRALRANDVALDVLYCGVCHSDMHMAHNDWGIAIYPVVPGHEIIGRVTAVGPDVTRHKVGDVVAVGCMVDSCLECDTCHRGDEQLCRHGMTMTYGSRDRHDGSPTLGGYSQRMVVRQEFVLTVPAGLDIKRAAPLLCAGITTYSPLRKYNVGPGSRVGVVGLGGLGHMAVKLAAAMGATVTVISRAKAKAGDAKQLGADYYLVSTDADAMAKAAYAFDLIIDTVPVRHDLNPYLPLLDVDGTLCIVGQLGPVEELNTMGMMFGRRQIAGSPIGGLAQTQEMLDFCARKNILPDTEMISMGEINRAWERMEKADVRYRFVIDMASL